MWGSCAIPVCAPWSGCAKTPPSHAATLPTRLRETVARGSCRHCFFSSLPSSAGMVGSRCCHPLGARSHSGVVLGKGVALLPGGSCWWRQLWLCVPSKSYSISCLPNTPQPRWLQPRPRPHGPHPDCNPCFSLSWSCMCACVCVCVRFLAVFAGPGQSRWLAQM